MIISCIVATNKDGLIGINNQIPWHLPADLKYFKKITSGHHILMGRKCYESIGKALPNRTNIIVSRSKDLFISDAFVVNTIMEGIKMAQDNGEEELFIIGGGEIYKLTEKLWDKIYITLVDYEGTGDVYFPKLEDKEWKILKEEKFLADEKNTMSYRFRILCRYDK